MRVNAHACRMFTNFCCLGRRLVVFFKVSKYHCILFVTGLCLGINVLNRVSCLRWNALELCTFQLKFGAACVVRPTIARYLLSIFSASVFESMLIPH